MSLSAIFAIALNQKLPLIRSFKSLTALSYFSCEMILRKCLQYSQVSSCRGPRLVPAQSNCPLEDMRWLILTRIHGGSSSYYFVNWHILLSKQCILTSPSSTRKELQMLRSCHWWPRSNHCLIFCEIHEQSLNDRKWGFTTMKHIRWSSLTVCSGWFVSWSLPATLSCSHLPGDEERSRALVAIIFF